MDELDRDVSHVQFAGLVGLSRQAVGDLSRRGVLTPGASVRAWVHEYAESLRESARSRTSGPVHEAQLGLNQARAMQVAHRVGDLRRQVAPVRTLELVVQFVVDRAAGIVDAQLPVVLDAMDGLPADAVALVSDELARVCTTLRSASVAQALAPEDTTGDD